VDALDQIPWNDLTHAYGSAADVPDLLRSLGTASPDLQGEDSPLWQLFGNIWHQGTVYEATAYAVPFLIELAVDRRTPDRVGILSLLAEIAKGNSYREVHGNLLKEPDFERKRTQELSWARQAHEAVAAGFTQFVDLTNETGDVRYASAHVLAQLPEHGAAVVAILRKLLHEEERIPYRAGLLLLLGSTGDVSHQTVTLLSDAANSSEAAERHAAAFSIVRLNVRPLPVWARDAVMDAIVAEDLELSLQDLPWEAASCLDANGLFASLEAVHQEVVAGRLITLLESCNLNAHGVATLVNLLFPTAARGPTPKVTASKMTPVQFRAVRALYEAMKGGKRVFYGHFPCWGLPDTMREWRELASGRDPSPVDQSLPLLADARRPQQAVAPGKLKIGQKIVHRYFGQGTVIELKVAHPFTAMTIRFDEEGVKQLSLPTDASP
jgi:PcrA/UvrD tudor domain